MKPVADQLESILAAAVEMDSDAKRREFVEQACAGDAELKQRVEELIENHFRAGSFLESPAPLVVATLDLPSLERPGTVIGPYKLLQQIGEGGMGVVFMAEQNEPLQRTVALKIIKPGMDTRQVIARFEAERQALAVMDHPNIAKVLDAGTTDSGRPYFVMELVKGVLITKYCDEHHLTPKERLELFMPVCQAVQHAHQKGIIHRDLKPSNLLVALYDGKPVPKVIDFGVAKATGPTLTERTLFTEFGQVIGTLEYMSPEQAELNQLDIDTRSDIYALGVLLYELLTGTTPLERKRLQEAAFDEMLRIIREDEPPKPSTRLSTTDQLPSIAANRGLEPKKLSGLVRGELDWIVMKCLEKDRNRRYETANGLAADVLRYLHDEPVQACPPSALYRFRKFARRNKAALAVAGLVLAFLVVLGSGIGWVARDRAARQFVLEQEVTRALEEAEQSYQRDKLPEALAAVQRAEGLLATGGATEALHQRVRQWRTDLDFVARLEEIRLDQSAVKDEGFDMASSDPAYREAFQRYGLDVEALYPDEAAERIKASAIQHRLVAGLDDWTKVTRGWRLPGAERLLTVARRADADPWRDQLREAVLRQDSTTLKRLARDQEVQSQPPATVLLLAKMLFLTGEVPLSVEVLRQSQQRHPNDFWINLHLAEDLKHLKPAQLDEAVGFYRAALALRPESPGVHNNLGIALQDQGKLDEAIAAYRKAIAIKPDHAAPHSNLGNALRDQGKLDEAVAAYRKAIALKPDFADAHTSLGKVLRDQGKLDQAIAALRNASALKPDYADAHSNLGIALQDQGRLDEAIAAFRQAIALKPDLGETHYGLGIALGKQGKRDEAIAAYRQAIALKPIPEAHTNLGNALGEQGKLDEAIAEYQKAIGLDPDFPEVHIAYTNLGNSLRMLGKLDEAIAACRKAIELKPDFATAYLSLGNVFSDQAKWEEAIAAYGKAIELKSDDSIAYTNLGNVFREQGKRDEAVAAHRKAIELQPDDAMVYNNLGVVFRDQGKSDEAVAAYRKAIELKSDCVGAYTNLGVALNEQGKRDEAVAAHCKAIELKPDFATAYVNLGIVFRDQGKRDEAIAAYQKAIELKPDFAEAYAGLGNVLNDQGKRDEAIAAYQKAIELKPDYAEAFHNLGTVFKVQGKLTDAIAAYHMAIELKPHALTFLNLADALKTQAKWDEWLAAVPDAAKLLPEVAQDRKSVAIALSNQVWSLAIHPDPKVRDPDSALELATKAVELGPRDTLSWQVLGWAYYRTGNWQASIEALEKSCKLQDDGVGDAFQWLFLAMAHWQLGRQEEARRWYDKALQTEKVWPEDLRRLRAEAAELLKIDDTTKLK